MSGVSGWNKALEVVGQEREHGSEAKKWLTTKVEAKVADGKATGAVSRKWVLLSL